jgi:hypothetical protein
MKRRIVFNIFIKTFYSVISVVVQYIRRSIQQSYKEDRQSFKASKSIQQSYKEDWQSFKASKKFSE